MTLVDMLGHLMAAAFLVVGLVAVWQWLRQRGRPAAYLAVAFLLVGVVLLGAQLVTDAVARQPWLGAILLTGLAAFPWLLAAFAWSFEGALPRWLRLSGLAIPALGAWVLVLQPFLGTDAEETLGQRVFVTVYLVLWATLALAMAVRLWRAGGRQRLVRARMRLMATGALLVTLALLLSATTGDEATPGTQLVIHLLALVAAGLFVCGFAPPFPLRAWWRRRSSTAFEGMQVALIRSATPHEVAAAVTPMLADLLGGGVAVVDDQGQVLASSQLSEGEARKVAHLLQVGGTLPEDLQAFAIGEACLVVRTTPYTPVFGQDEYELVNAFCLHLRLALERAELYRSEQAARQEAQVARQELESTLYGLSHDLKSPSLAISGFIDLLPRVETDEDREEMMGHIKASAAYLHQLVDALLEVSRIGRTQTEVRPVDLEATVAEVARRVGVEHPRATVRVERPLPWVELNPARAEQLIDNLVRNAVIHAGREDVEVTVDAAPHDGWLCLAVADDGRGIPEADRERIFELFQRGSTSGARGSGVGLGMVRRIAEGAGGTVTLADREVGACFEVWLPRKLVVEASPLAPEAERFDDEVERVDDEVEPSGGAEAEEVDRGVAARSHR